MADLRGHAVYKVTGTRLVESGTSSSKDDAKCVQPASNSMHIRERKA